MDPFLAFLGGVAVGVLVAAVTVATVNRRELARIGAPAGFLATPSRRRARGSVRRHGGRI